MTALGWEEEECVVAVSTNLQCLTFGTLRIYCEGCGYLACDAPWCYQCFDDDFDDDFDNWELSSNEEDSLSELAELLPEDEDARDARILLEIKAERHGDCIPAPHDYADSFLNIDRLLKDDGEHTALLVAGQPFSSLLSQSGTPVRIRSSSSPPETSTSGSGARSRRINATGGRCSHYSSAV